MEIRPRATAIVAISDERFPEAARARSAAAESSGCKIALAVDRSGCKIALAVGFEVLHS